ncbi:MAG: RNA polymerase subunit sigma-24, partial [Gammaproteobacteria bacterium]|nr:RNA polymerase subunit sigma-24 [Gammaproteobacteria bacterium]
HFDDQLLDLLAQEEPDFSERSHLLDALDSCLEKMDTEKRSLLMRRYEKTHSVEEIAEDQGYTANTLSQMLRRLRSRLSSCIEQELQSS